MASKESIIKKYNLRPKYAKKLKVLKEFKVVLILDDSGSMDGQLKNNKNKWTELNETCVKIVEILNAFNSDCDALFLNRSGVEGIRDVSQLKDLFKTDPFGKTPLTNCIKNAIQNNRMILKKKKLLLLVFTDGEPTSINCGDPIQELKNTLEKRDPIDRIFVSIIACTDKKETMTFLDDWDRDIKNLDVVDDYENEKERITSKGIYREFPVEDYLVKILLGSIDRKLDQMDEKTKVKKKVSLFN